jgi:hypothetical protein
MNSSLRLAGLGPLCAALAMAWQPPNGAGHWEGVIKGAGKDVAITVDLAVDQKGGWVGAMGMPAQGARDIPLSGITVQGDAVHFRMFDAAESPVFDGKLAAGGAAISGQVSGSGESTAFELKRNGEAVIQTPRASTPLSNDFVGTWEGLLGGGDRQLRLELKLAVTADGTGAGTLMSVGNASPQIPITTITQKDNRVEFEIRAIGGSYSGVLGDSRAEISGNWTQAGAATPLVFHRTKK